MPRGSDPNRCQASEVEPLAVARTRRGAAPPSPPAAQIIRPHQEPEEEAAEGEDEVSRLFDDDAKMDIFNKYAAWIKAGKIPADSPIDDLVNEHGCDRTYPSKLYKKVMKNGTIDNQWNPLGRPPIYSANAREQVVGKIREAREKQKVYSLRSVATKLQKQRKKKPAPKKDWVAAAKKELGFKKHKVSVQSSAVYCAVGMMATGPRVPMVRVPAHGCM